MFGERCASCHAGPQFTDGRFHVLRPPEAGDLGPSEVTHRWSDRGAFRTAPLRNVALTGPYLHDGSAASLREAVQAHGLALPARAELDLEAFLATMSNKKLVLDERFSLPRSFCGTTRTH